jgi:4-amino-4-deoxy-L-arabinose transferase-like glycosyltransferase
VPTPAAHQTAHRWSDLGIVAGAGIVARIVLLLLAPGYLTFPDSSPYILSLGNHQSAIRPTIVADLWWLGSFGQYHASSVAALQMVAGVFASLALFIGLRRVLPRWVALTCALGFTLFLPLLAFERVFLLEPFCSDLGALSICFFLLAVTSSAIRKRLGWFSCAAFSLALIVLVRPPLLMAVAVPFMVFLVAALRSTQSSNPRSRLGIVACMLLVFGLPLAAQASANRSHWHSFTLTPTANGFLLARWAPLISCPTPQDHLTPDARHFLQSACEEHSFGTPPGNNVVALWRAPFRGVLNLETLDQRTTSKELGAAVRHAMVQHPGTVARQVAASIWWQMALAPANDLDQYVPGPQPHGRHHRTKTQSALAKLANFFQTTQPADHGPNTLRDANQLGYRWPQFLLWADIALGLFAGLLALRRRARPSWRAVLSSTGLLALASSGFVGGLILNIAIGGCSYFRYLYPLVPWLFVLFGLGISSISLQLAQRQKGD